MQKAPCLSLATNQTTRSASVIGVIFQHLRNDNTVQNLIKRDALFYHRLLRVRGNPYLLRSRLSLYAPQGCRDAG
jgi:hypothetical protein